MPSLNLRAFVRDYALLLVLLVLCLVCSLATIAEHRPGGRAAGRALAADVVSRVPGGGNILIVAQDGAAQRQFGEALQSELQTKGVTVLETAIGGPREAGAALSRAVAAGKKVDVLACTPEAATWSVLETRRKQSPLLANMEITYPQPYYWPIFLTTGNLVTIVDQVAVTAIVAVGMTMVIVGGGIDLSVGSLMALASVVAALAMRQVAASGDIGPWIFLAGSLAAVVVCGTLGGVTGSLVTRFDVPPFIVTLSMMMVAVGLATRLSANETIGLPPSVGWLGRGRLWGLPYPVILMLAVYVAAHLVMSRTVFGRWLYAVGGNEKAAHLCGIPVARVRTITYVVSSALAAIGGIVLTSTLTSGNYKLGQGYELVVISAVVVGGASLTGGEGSMISTLLGSLIIAVIRNAMNLAGLQAPDQSMVFGGVILVAVLLDRLKRGSGKA